MIIFGEETTESITAVVPFTSIPTSPIADKSLEADSDIEEGEYVHIR